MRARLVLILGLGGCSSGVQPIVDHDREMWPIPGGDTILGCPMGSGCSERNPLRTVFVAAFEIDRTEVTVAAYRECVEAGACSTEGVDHSGHAGADDFTGTCNYPLNAGEHPMNCVNWTQADTYCEWAGKRLPTANEWEKAARGPDALEYPWGGIPARAGGLILVNLLDESGKKRFPHASVHLEGYDDGWATTAPVARSRDDRSRYGPHDMAGNVEEWLEDVIDAEPSNLRFRDVRGSSFYGNPLRSAAYEPYQLVEEASAMELGFRCAR